MRLGIIGLPGSGKTTVFQTLTRTRPDQWPQKGPVISTVQVSDKRLDTLTELTKPKKTVYAHLEYLLPLKTQSFGQDKKLDEGPFNEVRPCDGLIHVVRNFHLPGGASPRCEDDWQQIENEMIFADLVVVEKRIEKIKLDRKRGRKTGEEEMVLLASCLEQLEHDTPLRTHPELANAPQLRGYSLLSAKPVLTVFNNDEEDENLPALTGAAALCHAISVRGALEKELSELPIEDLDAFMAAYHLKRSAMERLIRHSCEVLGLICFFTVANREARAWLIPDGSRAIDAAGAIHTDMQKGFIRAEVVACDDLRDAGTYQQAKKEAKVHLEGKDYVVQDGDVIYFRFNV